MYAYNKNDQIILFIQFSVISLFYEKYSGLGRIWKDSTLKGLRYTFLNQETTPLLLPNISLTYVCKWEVEFVELKF